MAYPRGSLARFRKAAQEHLEWCGDNNISPLGGRWDTEDPITGLLLATCANPATATPILCALLDREWDSVIVKDLWWPVTPVDLLVSFEVKDSIHFLALEHKHVYSKSNYPGYRSHLGGVYSQIECLLREIDSAAQSRAIELLQGPFDPAAEQHLVVLDARGQAIDEIFTPDSNNTRNSNWLTVSYADFALRLRSAYESTHNPALIPVLGQLFAGWRLPGIKSRISTDRLARRECTYAG